MKTDSIIGFTFLTFSSRWEKLPFEGKDLRVWEMWVQKENFSI
jgi:hypothetical protein